jgi:hypothetical protein
MFKSDYMHLIVFSSCTLKYRPLTVFSSKGRNAPDLLSGQTSEIYTVLEKENVRALVAPSADRWASVVEPNMIEQLFEAK